MSKKNGLVSKFKKLKYEIIMLMISTILLFFGYSMNYNAFKCIIGGCNYFKYVYVIVLMIYAFIAFRFLRKTKRINVINYTLFSVNILNLLYSNLCILLFNLFAKNNNDVIISILEQLIDIVLYIPLLIPLFAVISAIIGATKDKKYKSGKNESIIKNGNKNVLRILLSILAILVFTFAIKPNCTYIFTEALNNYPDILKLLNSIWNSNINAIFNTISAIEYTISAILATLIVIKINKEI